MRLPRHIAQIEPASAPDPALVAAGSPATGVLVALDATNRAFQQYQETTQRAELASSYHSAMSESQAAVDEWRKRIADSGRFMLDENGAEVPTHTLVVQSYDQLANQLRNRASQFTKRLNGANRQKVEQDLEAYLVDQRAEVLKTQRQLFVSDMMATFDDNMAMYMGAKDFDGARQMIDDYFDGGVITADQRRQQIDSLRNRYALTTVQDMLASSSTTEDYRNVIEYVQQGEVSAAMTPEQRSTLIERALTRAEHVDDEADQRLTDRQAANAADLESLLYGEQGGYALQWEAISQAESIGDISPEQALRLRKARANILNQGQDDQDTLRYLESRIFTLSEATTDFDARRERVINELIQASDRLSGSTFGRMLGEVRQLDGQRFSNPSYRQADEYLKAAIMSIPAGFAMFADEATAAKTDAYNAASNALFRAAQEGGPDFDALDWAERNLERFKSTAKTATRAAPPAGVVKNAAGDVDFEATADLWLKLLNSGEILQLEYDQRVRELTEYRNGLSD